MTTKPRTSADADVGIEDDERHIGEVDDFISRNSEALNDSIRRSRSEVASGGTSRKSIGKIISEGRARLRAAGRR